MRLTLAVLLGWRLDLAAQTPAFEVASVRENKSGSATAFMSPGLSTVSGRANPRPGPVVFQNMPLREVIAAAYGIGTLLVQHLVTGGSERILSTRSCWHERGSWAGC